MSTTPSSAICGTAFRTSSTCTPPRASDERLPPLTIRNRYLVVDLMSGGDLRFHISRKTFTEEAVRFWIAELGCALRYIHGQNIIHRDVKPDNVLLDADGHVHLTDFVRPCGTRTSETVANSRIERGFGHHPRKDSIEQVRNPRISGPRSLCWQRLRCPCGLVVARRPILRVYLQQGTSLQNSRGRGSGRVPRAGGVLVRGTDEADMPLATV